MKVKKETVKSQIEHINVILDILYREEEKHRKTLASVHPSFQKSAANLIHYRTLREINITSLQRKLGNLGLSRIAKAQPHLVASLQKSRDILKALIKDHSTEEKHKSISIKRSRKTLNRNTKDLLGYRSKGRRVRIMVTLPSEAAYNDKLVFDLISAGMNTARINCAHDGPEAWTRMIENVNAAKKKLRKNCKISMDLAGPKIRTGAIEPGPQVKRFRPVRNEFGQVIAPAVVKLVPNLSASGAGEIPVDPEWIKALRADDVVVFQDTREKKRSFKVKQPLGTHCMAYATETFYVQTGTELINERTQARTKVATLPAIEQALLLKNGDTFRITKDNTPGRPTQYSDEGLPIARAFLPCTSQEIFKYVRAGERMLFDDGKITGKIKEVNRKEIVVEIVHAKSGGAWLKADKGINLPDTKLGIRGLTDKDRKDMEFVVQHADIINFSFVNNKDDVHELHTLLKKLNAKEGIGIILKIETQSAFNNLTSILLEAMKGYPVGVMIARGDLAIETGWENIARVQQEILRLCHAAHVPVVWATQVLESLAKKGLPSRSEITDAATSMNAECVMLNKGPYILKAIGLLDYLLKSLNKYRDKNQDFIPVMEKADARNAPAQNPGIRLVDVLAEEPVDTEEMH